MKNTFPGVAGEVGSAKWATVKVASQNKSKVLANHRGWNVLSTALLILLVGLPYLRYFQFESQGIQFDLMDIFLVPALLLGKRWSLSTRTHGQFRFSEMPHFRLWVFYGALISVAYLKWAFPLGILTDPVRIVYQLYRYCWKPMLFYPLVLIFFKEASQLKRLVFTVVLFSDIGALLAIWQGRLGENFLLSKNGIASALLVPGLLALCFAVYCRPLRKKIFYRSSFLIHLLALWYAQSRGAVAAFVASLVLFAILDGFLYTKKGALTLVFGGLLMVTTILLVIPDLGEKSGIIVGYMELTEPTEAGNMRWRLEQRWPFFLRKVLANPMFGVGEVSDAKLGNSGATPHNGYLAMAVKTGIPSLLVFLSFISIALGRALSTIKNHKDDLSVVLAIGMVCGITVMCIHNLVESLFIQLFGQIWFWVVLSLSVILSGSVHPGNLCTNTDSNL